MIAVLNKTATKKAIIAKCTSTVGYFVKKEEFDDYIITDDDYREACTLVGIEPIYSKL